MNRLRSEVPFVFRVPLINKTDWDCYLLFYTQLNFCINKQIQKFISNLSAQMKISHQISLLCCFQLRSHCGDATESVNGEPSRGGNTEVHHVSPVSPVSPVFPALSRSSRSLSTVNQRWCWEPLFLPLQPASSSSRKILPWTSSLNCPSLAPAAPGEPCYTAARAPSRGAAGAQERGGCRVKGREKEQ